VNPLHAHDRAGVDVRMRRFPTLTASGGAAVVLDGSSLGFPSVAALTLLPGRILRGNNPMEGTMGGNDSRMLLSDAPLPVVMAVKVTGTKSSVRKKTRSALFFVFCLLVVRT
jgi:hypothetical protein